ncbi:hypothetical protein E0493_03835 [Roseomonas sp. M0104]|uniref:Uncharacterized protein n=1 Tax=Teichococcus coralli TaxID=2545983 RepID=A0A845B8R6_9PROT|nr:hypothetical protein [Pseudoroseomonas coralli]MXP62484.1 hypothetical protein [Pseudoroseomonas coralli]
MRRVAEDLEDASPEIARHVRSAADSVDSLATALRERSVGDLVGEVNEFARRQPVAFFGAAMVAGFALTRFARSSARDTYPPRSTAGSGSMAHRAGRPAYAAADTNRSPTMAPGWVPDGTDRKGSAESGELRPATMPAATLGGAAAHKPGTASPGSMPGPTGGTP